MLEKYCYWFIEKDDNLHRDWSKGKQESPNIIISINNVNTILKTVSKDNCGGSAYYALTNALK